MMSELAKIIVTLPDDSSLLNRAAKIHVEGKELLLFNYEIKSHGGASDGQEPCLVLHVAPECFEIQLENKTTE